MSESSPIMNLSWEAAHAANRTFGAIQAAKSRLNQLEYTERVGFSEAAWDGLTHAIEQRRATKTEEFEALTSMAALVMQSVDSPFGHKYVETASEPKELGELTYHHNSMYFHPSAWEKPAPESLERALDKPLRLIGELQGPSHSALDWVADYTPRNILAMGSEIVIESRPKLGVKAKKIIAASLDALEAPYPWKKKPTMSDIAKICPTLDQVPAECLRNDLKVAVAGKSVLDIVLLRPHEVFANQYSAELRVSSDKPKIRYYGNYKSNPTLGAELIQQAHTFALTFFEEKQKLGTEG